MAVPRFSIVIPTRNRPELAIQAIRSVLLQTYVDFEVLVLENSDNNCLSLTEFRDDPRVRIMPSTSVLSMPDNWERGLSVARGEFIAYISDKDRFVCTALEIVADAIDEETGCIFNYRKAWFESDSAILAVQRCTNGRLVIPTSDVLLAWFDTVTHRHNAPMIYCSFVRNSLVQELRSINGRFFFGNAPDVCSGILLTAMRESYVLIDRVLSIANSGNWSNGIAVRDHGDRHAVSGAFLREFGEDPIRRLGLPPTVSTAAAEVLHSCQAAFPSLLSGYSINWRRCISNAIDEIQERNVADNLKIADLAFLLRHPYMKNRFSRLSVSVDRWCRGKCDRASRKISRVERALRKIARRMLPRRDYQGPWDDRCWGPPVKLSTIDEAVRYVEGQNKEFPGT